MYYMAKGRRLKRLPEPPMLSRRPNLKVGILGEGLTDGTFCQNTGTPVTIKVFQHEIVFMCRISMFCKRRSKL